MKKFIHIIFYSCNTKVCQIEMKSRIFKPNSLILMFGVIFF